MKPLLLLFLLVGAGSLRAHESKQPRVNRGVAKAVHLQVFLDHAGFRPGAIDGTFGGFTTAALHAYQRSFQWTLTLPKAHKLPVESVGPPFTQFTIRPSDLDWIGPMPATIELQSREKRLPYTSLAEFVAERFHCNLDFLARLNRHLKLDQLKPGDTLWAPNVRPFRIEDLPGEAQRARPPNPDAAIRIDTRTRTLTLTEKGRVTGIFPISPGSKEHPAPPGSWKIARIVLLPWYRYDESVLKGGKRSDLFFMLPPGPNNPVGAVWMALNRPGIGLHGTPVPDKIGRNFSHGCIRLSNWDAVRLSRLAGPGTPVTIQ